MAILTPNNTGGLRNRTTYYGANNPASTNLLNNYYNQLKNNNSAVTTTIPTNSSGLNTNPYNLAGTSYTTPKVANTGANPTGLNTNPYNLANTNYSQSSVGTPAKTASTAVTNPYYSSTGSPSAYTPSSLTGNENSKSSTGLAVSSRGGTSVAPKANGTVIAPTTDLNNNNNNDKNNDTTYKGYSGSSGSSGSGGSNSGGGSSSGGSSGIAETPVETPAEETPAEEKVDPRKEREDYLNKMKELLDEQLKKFNDAYKAQLEEQYAKNKSLHRDNADQINLNKLRAERYSNSLYGNESGAGARNNTAINLGWMKSLNENNRNLATNDSTALTNYNTNMANAYNTLASAYGNAILPVYTNQIQNDDELDYRRRANELDYEYRKFLIDAGIV